MARYLTVDTAARTRGAKVVSEEPLWPILVQQLLPAHIAARGRSVAQRGQLDADRLIHMVVDNGWTLLPRISLASLLSFFDLYWQGCARMLLLEI